MSGIEEQETIDNRRRDEFYSNSLDILLLRNSYIYEKPFSEYVLDYLCDDNPKVGLIFGLFTIMFCLIIVWAGLMIDVTLAAFLYAIVVFPFVYGLMITIFSLQTLRDNRGKIK